MGREGLHGRGELPIEASINVTSMVDVAFVLLIIFMITAPIMQGGVDVQLPRTEAQPIQPKQGLTVTIDKDGMIFIDDDPSDAAVEKREELRLSFKSKIDDFWSISLRTQRDLRDDGGTLFSGMQIRYEDECFIFTANAERRFTQDADFDPSDKIFFRLTFKNLGSLTTAAK
ncbi:MAG: LPS-assembly protein LptD [Alphaproteobacteria bacterium MarineAlpha10_Bin3]|nr:MAG: LPS-assembly protein LptD [Alphaproteobacteria bacterium MarineAlpha10_Bin3]PPR70846.1 MAG: LPS-assembly protein LptD [Alphaproteobacteria bacterium MarineAlpha4_Bin1]